MMSGGQTSIGGGGAGGVIGGQVVEFGHEFMGHFVADADDRGEQGFVGLQRLLLGNVLLDLLLDLLEFLLQGVDQALQRLLHCALFAVGQAILLLSERLLQVVAIAFQVAQLALLLRGRLPSARRDGGTKGSDHFTVLLVGLVAAQLALRKTFDTGGAQGGTRPRSRYSLAPVTAPPRLPSRGWWLPYRPGVHRRLDASAK